MSSVLRENVIIFLPYLGNGKMYFYKKHVDVASIRYTCSRLKLEWANPDIVEASQYNISEKILSLDFSYRKISYNREQDTPQNTY